MSPLPMRISHGRIGPLAKGRILNRFGAAVFRQSLADAGGKIRRVIGGFRALGDVAPCSEICERQICVDLAAFVEEFVEVAVDEQAPVERPAGACVLHVTADRCRAVLRQSIVPLRVSASRFISSR